MAGSLNMPAGVDGSFSTQGNLFASVGGATLNQHGSGRHDGNARPDSLFAVSVRRFERQHVRLAGQISVKVSVASS